MIELEITTNGGSFNSIGHKLVTKWTNQWDFSFLAASNWISADKWGTRGVNEILVQVDETKPNWEIAA